jgi:hypothetical protein
VAAGTYLGADMFNGNANAQSFTVPASAAVPEPSSMLLCGLASLGGAYSIYRRRKAKTVEVVAEVPAVA